MNLNLNVLLSSSFLMLAFGVQAQHMATGTVFNDLNQNGKQDRREAGIPNVAVSNGEDVVVTDAKGKYELTVGEDNIVFVVKPSGYTLPLDELNHPQSYYIHKPQGSPKELTYPGVAPTGPLPKSIDFGLQQTEESNQFRALVFGDPQAYTEQEIAFFNRAMVDEVEGIQGVSFGISLGDLVGDDLTLHPKYKASVGRIGIPWYNVKGNHDMNYDVQADSLSDETFESYFGPASYSFNYGKVHFIVLDDIRYPNPRTGKGYLGGLTDVQLKFVENDLKFVPKDHLVVLAFHIPLEHQNGDRFRAEDRDRLFELLQDYPNTLSLSAHTHTQTQIFYDRSDGWKQDQPHHEYNVGTTSGDWYSGELDKRGVPVATMRDGTPHGYAFIDFRDNDYNIRYQVSGKDSTYQINLFHPQVIGQGGGNRGAIFANFFMGHQGNTVEYSIDGGEWKKMNAVKAPDPAYLSSLHPWDHSETLLPGRRPSNAVESNHLWRVALPGKLDVGTHEIRVRATDDYGNAYEAKSTYRIEAAKNHPAPSAN
ncbi:MAG: calcineurin-like phosphoesterase C-terminal domain-containing protein [Sphingobacterium sp.]